MPSVVVVGAQWGDEGKGKITDYLAATADTVVRYQGGHNAGHTVVAGGREYRLHLVPSGIVHGKRCVIGNGVVLDPWAFWAERQTLAAQGCAVDRVVVSDCAHLILPHHQALDAADEGRRGADRLGTTLLGIGPAYQDKAARVGLRVGDLLHPRTLEARLRAALERSNGLLGLHSLPETDPETLLRRLREVAELLAPHVGDTAVLVNEALDRGERVLFEGAQGTLLDIDHGTYPYVTSSHPTAGGACIGAGVGPGRLQVVLGVTKAYTTRVGDGPFPTELEDRVGEHLREHGREFGTTTGRPRRCGWLDAVVLRHAAMVNGLTGLCVTKLDTLSGVHPLRVAVAYEIGGRPVQHLPHHAEDLAACRPVYEELPGWDDPLGELRDLRSLPPAARRYLERIEQLVGIPVDMVSVGAERAQTIAVREPFAAAASAMT
jgi:adenylosuccinate synthase